MNFYETKHQYITKSGEVRIYKYNVQYQSRPKKYDSIKETYKDIINDDTIPRNEKINKIYKERLRYGTISLFKRLEEMGNKTVTKNLNKSVQICTE